jgi:hypothetical protein
VNAAGNQTTSDIQVAIDAAMNRYFSALPIGGMTPGVVFYNGLIGVLENANAWIIDTNLTSPGTSVGLGANEVPTYAGTTITVNQVTV